MRIFVTNTTAFFFALALRHDLLGLAAPNPGLAFSHLQCEAILGASAPNPSPAFSHLHCEAILGGYDAPKPQIIAPAWCGARHGYAVPETQPCGGG